MTNPAPGGNSLPGYSQAAGQKGNSDDPSYGRSVVRRGRADNGDRTRRRSGLERE